MEEKLTDQQKERMERNGRSACSDTCQERVEKCKE